MAVNALARLAAAAPAPVYAVAGAHARQAVENLALDPRISLEASVRHASLLLVTGDIRDEDVGALHLLHDQLAHPRTTVFWGVAPHPSFHQPVAVPRGEDAAGALARVWHELLAGRRGSEDDLLPDEPPAPWRGKGDHGQGGEGMMGGKPYGRPMAMTGDDLRDGLALDAYTAPIGPFLPMLPPGLVLELTLQGDVVQKAKVRRAPYPQITEPGAATSLRSIARVLRVLGMEAQARRFFRAAIVAAAGRAPAVAALRRRFTWSGAVLAIPPGLGKVALSDGNEGDVRDRLRRWWSEVEHAFEGDGAARDTARPTMDVRLVDLLAGLEWHEAILVINSFDEDVLARLTPPAPKEDDDDDDEDCAEAEA